MRIGARTPRAMASTEVARSLANMTGSREGAEMVLMRKRRPRTTATALRPYTSGLVFMNGEKWKYLIIRRLPLVAGELPVEERRRHAGGDRGQREAEVSG